MPANGRELLLGWGGCGHFKNYHSANIFHLKSFSHQKQRSTPSSRLCGSQKKNLFQTLACFAMLIIAILRTLLVGIGLLIFD